MGRIRRIRQGGPSLLDTEQGRNYYPLLIMFTLGSDVALVRQIEDLSGQVISDCYQCGCCTAGCPVGEAMDPGPSEAIRLLQLGRVQELVDSDGIWLCASCMVCGTRCPRGVDYARIAEACRALVLRTRVSKVDPGTVTEDDCEEIPQQAFMASFRKFSV